MDRPAFPPTDLHDVAPFADLDAEALDRICRSAAFLRHPTGSVLVQRGADVAACHVLVEGLVVTYAEQDGDQLLMLHRAPYVLCLSEILQATPSVVSARTVGRARVASVPAGAMLDHIDRSAGFLASILEVLASQRREALRELLSIRTFSASERLAAWILAEDASHGRLGEFLCPLTTEEVASLLGYSHSHFVRKVCRKAEDAVTVRGRRWTILDREALVAMAGEAHAPADRFSGAPAA